MLVEERGLTMDSTRALAAMTILLLAGWAAVCGAQERTPAWEIFAEPETPPDAGLGLEIEEPPPPPPKYTLDELVQPRVSDPDVYIRYSPGEPAPAEAVPAEEPAAAPAPVSQPTGAVSPPRRPGPRSLALPGAVGGVIPLRSVRAEVPIVRTFEDYRRALENNTPEIMFEGKRWVLSETENRYVQPEQLALDEARRTQAAMSPWPAAPVGAATGFDAFGMPYDNAALFQPFDRPPLTPDSPDFPITRATDRYRLRGLRDRALQDRGVSPFEQGMEPAPQVPRVPREGFMLRGVRDRPDYSGQR